MISTVYKPKKFTSLYTKPCRVAYSCMGPNKGHQPFALGMYVSSQLKAPLLTKMLLTIVILIPVIHSQTRLYVESILQHSPANHEQIKQYMTILGKNRNVYVHRIDTTI